MDDLQWVLDGNIKTTFMMTQACLTYLEESKGQIINMSSFSGSRPVSVIPVLPLKITKPTISLCHAEIIMFKSIHTQSLDTDTQRLFSQRGHCRSLPYFHTVATLDKEGVVYR